jgi:fluoride ion exporter CrcB/FEX
MIEPFAVGIGAVGGALSRWQLTTMSTKFGLTPWSTAGLPSYKIS